MGFAGPGGLGMAGGIAGGTAWSKDSDLRPVRHYPLPHPPPPRPLPPSLALAAASPRLACLASPRLASPRLLARLYTSSLAQFASTLALVAHRRRSCSVRPRARTQSHLPAARTSTSPVPSSARPTPAMQQLLKWRWTIKPCPYFRLFSSPLLRSSSLLFPCFSVHTRRSSRIVCRNLLPRALRLLFATQAHIVARPC